MDRDMVPNFKQEEYAKAGLKTFPGSYGLGVTRWSALGAVILLFAASVAAVPYGLGSWLLRVNRLIKAQKKTAPHA